MPKFEVSLKITSLREKPIVVYAEDCAEAEEKAVDIVLSWPNVDEAEAVSIEEM